MAVSRAVATLGIGDHVERVAEDALARLDALVDEGEPVISAYRPEQDGPWLIDVLFSAGTEADRERWVTEAGGLVPALAHATWDSLADRDWVAESQKALRPVRAGRFVIHGAHDRANVAPSRWRLEIEAGRAFGTAHHASTKGALIMLERLARRGMLASVADVGTGTGVLALAADRLGGHVVAASDIDPVAVRVARDNLRANRMRVAVTPVVADGPLVAADTVIANILARPIIAMAPRLARLAGRRLILSGLRRRDGRRVAAAYRPRGFVTEETIVIEDWITMVFVRPSIRGTGNPWGRDAPVRRARNRAWRGSRRPG